MQGEEDVPVRTEADILTARQTGKAFAGRLGFTDADAVLIATAISEVVMRKWVP